MEQLLSKNSHNRDRIKPYIGGDEVNTSPSQSNHRYIIDFEDFPEDKRGNGLTCSRSLNEK